LTNRLAGLFSLRFLPMKTALAPVPKHPNARQQTI
jgi:hypothetical protein